MKQSYFKLLAVFFLSVALIAYEIAVMRTFAVGSWSNFGSMVISIALLGFGLAGTLLTFLQKFIREKPNRWLSTSALLLMPSMALAHVFAQLVPFNPVMLVSDMGQVALIGLYYIIYAVPFFFGAAFIGVAFIALSSQIHKLYFWNMAGSGVGGFVILGCMYFFPPEILIIPLLVISFISVIFCSLRFDIETRRFHIQFSSLFMTILIFIASFLLIITFGNIRVSEYKPISYARRFPDTALTHHSYSPTGEMHVYTSSFFHSAPGLSDNVVLYLREMPRNAFKGLYIDGGGPIVIPRQLKPDEEKYLEFLPMAAPYELQEKPRVLLVRLGGGASVFTALHYNSRAIKVVENDHAIVNLIKNVKAITDFNEHLLENPAVEVVSGEPRAYCATTKDLYDIVEISLIDSVGLSQTGGYSVDENYTYTVEAFEDYMRCLDENGILSITVWNRLTPPRNVPKLIATVFESLRRQGVNNPENRIFIFNVLLSTATVLVKNSAFTPQEIAALRLFCRKMSFLESYYPGMQRREKDFEKILADYTAQYQQEDMVQTGRPDIRKNNEGISMPSATEYPDLDPDDLYHFVMFWLVQNRGEELFEKYVFDIRPATDDRPYYTAYLRPETMSMFFDELGEISEEWGYLLLLGTLIQSVFFGFLIIVIPITGRWREFFRGRRGTMGVIVYFSCLGLAYMLIEIFLIQKLVFFLGDPIFSVSIVITSMLILSGLGSLFSQRFRENRAFGVRLAAGGIVASIVFYIFGLSPCLRLFLGLPFILKVILSIIFIAPASFFMGVPFPSGLSALSSNRQRLLPWAWGMNGALSVSGSVIARLISISTGFIWVLCLAGALYLFAALVFKANEAPDEIVKKKKKKGKEIKRPIPIMSVNS
jgi:spermidine synthase